MRVTWKGEQLGDLDTRVGLTVKEMRRVKAELGTAYRHPAKFIAAAFDFTSLVPALGPDGKPAKGEDGKPLMRTEPSDDWDPDAFAMLVCILYGRIGRQVWLEDVDGTLADLQAEVSPGEREAIAKAAQEAGKALVAPDLTSPATTSTDGSPSVPSDSGSTSASQF